MSVIYKFAVTVKKVGTKAVFICTNKKDHTPQKDKEIANEEYSVFSRLIKIKPYILHCDDCGFDLKINKR